MHPKDTETAEEKRKEHTQKNVLELIRMRARQRKKRKVLKMKDPLFSEFGFIFCTIISIITVYFLNSQFFLLYEIFFLAPTQ